MSEHIGIGTAHDVDQVLHGLTGTLFGTLRHSTQRDLVLEQLIQLVVLLGKRVGVAVRQPGEDG